MFSKHLIMEKHEIESETLSSRQNFDLSHSHRLSNSFSHLNNETVGFFRFFLVLRIRASKYKMTISFWRAAITL